MNHELQELLFSLDEDKYNNWVMGWLNPEYVTDIINNWDEDTQNEAIIEIKKLIEGDKK